MLGVASMRFDQVARLLAAFSSRRAITLSFFFFYFFFYIFYFIFFLFCFFCLFFFYFFFFTRGVPRGTRRSSTASEWCAAQRRPLARRTIASYSAMSARSIAALGGLSNGSSAVPRNAAASRATRNALIHPRDLDRFLRFAPSGIRLVDDRRGEVEVELVVALELRGDARGEIRLRVRAAPPRTRP
jgi:hypothetical protein